MKPFHNSICISMLFSLLLFGGIFYYVSTQFEARSMALKEQETRINENINALETSQQKAQAQLEERILKENVAMRKEFGSLVEEITKESRESLASVTGQLQSIEVESKQKIGELQKQILNINVSTASFANVIEKAIKSVVSINTDVGTGSGAIIDKDGYIITNRHVVEGAKRGSVKTSDGKMHRVRIIAISPRQDLAVAKIDENYPALRFGESSALTPGTPVIALGSPAGLEFSVTEGIVSAVRKIGKYTYIQTDLSLNPGNSGGPLLNTKGEIVGINTLKLSGYEGLGFAQAADEVTDFAFTAIEEDRKALAEGNVK